MNRNILLAALPFILALMFSFTGCKKKDVPVLETNEVTEIDGTTAICGGNITSDGGETIISRGVCWSKNLKPTITDSKTIDGAGAGSFTSSITNLAPASTYFVRAYATSRSGTGYGMAMSFKTLGEAPATTTLAASNLTTTTATLSAIINTNYLSTTVSFEYGTTVVYGNSVAVTQSPITGSIESNVSVAIIGLTAGTTYHYRVKAENSLGITYGVDMTFITLGQVPTATTLEATDLLATSATLRGLVYANYLSTTVTFEYGISAAYGSTISASPNSVTGNSVISVSAHLSGLTEGTTYHFRIKAINSLGTTYGTDMSFLASDPVPVIDIEGNVYSVIQLRTQIWMAENLKTTKFNDNTDIPLVSDNNEWIALTTSGFCWYNNDEAFYKDSYGALYNFYAANSGKLCPTGWHVPSDADFTTLTDFLGGIDNAGGKMKETGIDHWFSPNTGATNESGFTALPGGQRDETALFIGSGSYGVWWTSTPYNSFKPWYRSLSSNNSVVYVGNGSLNIRGFSIRCLKN